MDTIILGDGPLGRAIADAFRGRAGTTASCPRPAAAAPPRPGRPRRARRSSSRRLARDAVAANVDAAPRRRLPAASSSRRPAGSGPRPSSMRLLRAARRGRRRRPEPEPRRGPLLPARRARDRAARRRIDGFEPYLVEWHRRAKRDRPSGTARELARRIIAAPRADLDDRSRRPRDRGHPRRRSPGMHLVGFDSPGETIELRLTARDRSPMQPAPWPPPTGSPRGRDRPASTHSTPSSTSCSRLRRSPPPPDRPTTRGELR